MNRTSTVRILTAALASAALLAACSDDTPTDVASGPTTTAATSTTTQATVAVQSHGFVVLLDDDSNPDQVEGEPGAYAMTARGAGEPPWAVVDIPAGYHNFGFFAVWLGEDSDEPFRSLQYWTVHAVFEDPCRTSAGAEVIGDSVDDLAEALAAQRRTGTTSPKPITLDGHAGVTFRLTMPARLDFGRCDTGYFMLWEGSYADAQHTADGPGLVERLWVLDVDGQRIVLAAPAARGVRAADAAELAAMAESVRFVQRD